MDVKLSKTDKVVITLPSGMQYIITTIDAGTAIKLQKKHVDGLSILAPETHVGSDFIIVK